MPQRFFGDARRRHAAQQMILNAVPMHHGKAVRTQVRQIVEGYGTVDVPCLIVWGADDQLFHVSMGHKLAAEIPVVEE